MYVLGWFVGAGDGGLDIRCLPACFVTHTNEIDEQFERRCCTSLSIM